VKYKTFHFRREQRWTKQGQEAETTKEKPDLELLFADGKSITMNSLLMLDIGIVVAVGSADLSQILERPFTDELDVTCPTN